MRLRRMTRDELAQWYLRAALPPGMPASGRGAAGWQGLRLVSGAVSDDRSVSCAWAGLGVIAHAGHHVMEEIAAMLPIDGDARNDGH
jgi:hypothetical protein